MNETYLEHLRWLKTGKNWVYNTPEGDFLVQLQDDALTCRIRNSADLHFDLPPQLLTRMTGTRRRVRPPTASTSTSSTPRQDMPFSPPAAPRFPEDSEIPLEQSEFQRTVFGILRSVWTAVSRCRCMVDTDAIPSSAAGPSHTPAPDDADSEDTSDED